MLSIETFIAHELQRTETAADFHVQVEDDGAVCVSFARGGELCIRFWQAADARIVLSVTMTPGSHSVRALARSELAVGLSGILQRWLLELDARPPL